jgi:hypothetical protein
VSQILDFGDEEQRAEEGEVVVVRPPDGDHHGEDDDAVGNTPAGLEVHSRVAGVHFEADVRYVNAHDYDA